MIALQLVGLAFVAWAILAGIGLVALWLLVGILAELRRR